MDFCQNCHSLISTEAYEKLMYDAIRGESTLFTRWDETEFSWKYVEKKYLRYGTTIRIFLYIIITL